MHIGMPLGRCGYWKVQCKTDIFIVIKLAKRYVPPVERYVQTLTTLKQILLLIFITTISAHSFGADFSNWGQNTPNGNEIYYDNWGTGYLISIRCQQEGIYSGIDNLDRWYFYDNKVVSKLTSKSDNSYFIFNEIDCRTYYFSTLEDFETYILRHKIRPKLWTRWYSSYHGKLYTSVNCFLCTVDNLVFGVLILILTIWGFVYFIRNKFNVGAIKRILFIIWILSITTRLLLDIYPQSI